MAKQYKLTPALNNEVMTQGSVITNHWTGLEYAFSSSQIWIIFIQLVHDGAERLSPSSQDHFVWLELKR